MASLGIFEEQDHCHALQYTFGVHQCVLTTEVHVGLIEELLYYPQKPNLIQLLYVLRQKLIAIMILPLGIKPMVQSWILLVTIGKSVMPFSST